MEIIITVILWELSLVGAFLLGVIFNPKIKKNKTTVKTSSISEENKKNIKRMQKELENFMTYDGTPQEAINDYK